MIQNPCPARPDRRRCLQAALFAAASVLAGCAPTRHAPEADARLRALLAPTGRLRAGLYAGTPTSVLIDPAGGERKGVGFELGRALAQQLGVPYEAVVLPNNAAVLAALIQGEVDVVFTNASPERAAQMRFTQPYLDIELGLLVPAGSTLRSVTDIDRPGQTLGVTAKSSSDAYWSHQLHSAGLQRAATLQQGSEWLAQGQIQAYATNKATLFEMAETLPGARVLPDRWGLERHAIGIAPAREDGLGFLQRFADEQKAAGMIQRAAARAGLRGVAQ